MKSNKLLAEDPWFAWNTLTHVLPYLEAHELLKLSKVCKLWNQIVFDPTFWRNVTFRRCKLHVESMVDFLATQETVGLTFIDCIFVRNILKIDSVQGTNLLSKISKLGDKSLANDILKNLCICENFRKISLDFLNRLPYLVTLTLNCNSKINCVESTLALKNLKYLSFSNVANISEHNLYCLKELESLKHLDLGNCSKLSKKFYNETLKNIIRLTTLRLGNPNPGYKELKTLKNIISTVIRNIKTLKRFELLHVYMHYELYVDLSLCKNLEKVVLVPAIVDSMYLFEKMEDLKNVRLAFFNLSLSSQHLDYFCRTFKFSNDNESFLMDTFALEETGRTKILLDAINARASSKIIDELNIILKQMLTKSNVCVTKWNK